MNRFTVASVALSSTLLAACAETALDPAGVRLVESGGAQVTDTRVEQTLIGKSTFDSEANRVAFATTQGSTWDDIVIDQGGTQLTEDFNTGAWNTTNFELAVPDPSITPRPASAASFAYMSTGVEDFTNTPVTYTARSALRTKVGFKPTSISPLIIEATLTASPTLDDISFLLWRGSGLVWGAHADVQDGLALRIHNFVGGYTPVREVATADGSAGLEGSFGDDFYRLGPVRIHVVDDGLNVTARFTPIRGEVITSEGFLAPVTKGRRHPVVGGSTVPLKFRVLNGGAPTSDRTVIQSIRVSACGGGGESTDATSPGAKGLSGVRYLAGTRQFVFPWQVPSTSGCRRVTVTLRGDVTFHAEFDIRR